MYAQRSCEALYLKEDLQVKASLSTELNTCSWLIATLFYDTNRMTKKSTRSKELGETSKSMILRSTSSKSLWFLEPNAQG